MSRKTQDLIYKFAIGVLSFRMVAGRAKGSRIKPGLETLEDLLPSNPLVIHGIIVYISIDYRACFKFLQRVVKKLSILFLFPKFEFGLRAVKKGYRYE